MKRLQPGDEVMVTQVYGDNVSLMRDKQIVESTYEIEHDSDGEDFYGVDLVNCTFMLTNRSVKLVKSITVTSGTYGTFVSNKQEEKIIEENKEEIKMEQKVETSKQEQTLADIERILTLFQASDAEIRPHFILTGPSGAGKTWNIENLCSKLKLKVVDINAAQLTKEGMAGNSLSKALVELVGKADKPVVCFVDEFDKLFLSGNCNTQLAHESTAGVQNEFLKVLESGEAVVAGDYGKYNKTPVKKVLFIFAGAFNNEEDIDIDRLRDFGMKTEFIGRVGLVYNLTKLTLDTMLQMVRDSSLLKTYIDLHDGVDSEKAINTISEFVTNNYENNTIGARLINTLIHQYFIKRGELGIEEVKHISFQKQLNF